ncbi:uncharacterized protein LY79DRAFT_579406 [Colletotrichum navitas]|uniref:Uncharacterized protein n=1 Tax=Colletotrichum navitas TaxID=681940 RepID=A0AAD8Q1U9_9PEZI|nr:uncharacterized protein LY79DRAFT_579406 [Colletotrichum navitas]KAK1593309.1 hypothetical protein LY79DRAFT_579406 [Colletotrichum navitas]
MSVLGLVRVVIGRLRPSSRAVLCRCHTPTDCGNPLSPAVKTVSATTSYSSHRLYADESQTASDMAHWTAGLAVLAYGCGQKSWGQAAETGKRAGMGRNTMIQVLHCVRSCAVAQGQGVSDRIPPVQNCSKINETIAKEHHRRSPTCAVDSLYLFMTIPTVGPLSRG